AAGDVGVAGAVHRDGAADVHGAAAQVGRVDQGAAGGVELGHEGALEAGEGRLQRVGGWEVGRAGLGGEVGVAGAAHREAIGESEAAAAQVGGVDQGAARGVQLGHEGVANDGVAAPPEGRLQGVGRGEVGGTGVAGEVGVAGAIHRDAVADVVAAAAQVGGVDQGGARRVQLGHEGVHAAVQGRLEGAGGGGEVGGGGAAGEVGVARPVYRDGVALGAAAAAQVGGVQQGAARGIELAHEGIVAAGTSGLKGAGGGREVGRVGEA